MTDCSEIRMLLSEYLDGSLEAKARALVQEHLDACPACREELDALKSLVKGVGSLESVKAPADFLDQLHRRMERRSRISKIKEWLFYPLRVKIPLEVAGAVALAFILFSILPVQQAPLHRYPKSGLEKKAEGKAYYVDENKEAKPVGRSEALVQRAATQDSARETRELVLSLKQQARAKETPQPSAAPAPSSAPASAAALEGQKQKLAAGAPLEEGKKENQPKKEPESVLSVTRAIETSRGRLLSIDYDRQTGRAEFVKAEIPAADLPLLYEKLKQLGDLQVSPEARTAKDSSPVHVRIRLIDSH